MRETQTVVALNYYDTPPPKRGKFKRAMAQRSITSFFGGGQGTAKKRKGEGGDPSSGASVVGAVQGKTPAPAKKGKTECVPSFAVSGLVLAPDWREKLEPELSKPYFANLVDFLQKEDRAGKSVYPPPGPWSSRPSTAVPLPT